MKYLLIVLLVACLLVSCSGQSGSMFSSNQPTKTALDFSNPDKIFEYYERGKYLTSTVGACGHCHGVNLNGKTAPNITSDPASGIGNWKVNEIVDLLKGDRKTSGKMLSSDVHLGLPWISDYDARSIAIYLLTTKPIKSATKKDEKSGIMDALSSRENVKGFVIHPKENANASYGRYLALNVASCQTCHGEALMGSDIAPKLHKRVAKWPKEHIVNYLKTGSTPSGKKVNPRLCPWPYYRLANVSDQQAIAFFLKNLK
jgi:cytochrome c553